MERKWDAGDGAGAERVAVAEGELGFELGEEFWSDEVLDEIGVAVDVIRGDASMFVEVELPEAVGADDANCVGETGLGERDVGVAIGDVGVGEGAADCAAKRAGAPGATGGEG